ncbi:hypothetical protein QE429_004766 [Bacillus sp. SORGH_AS 510]|nr:hypothetical protein [Bacillus sp. SORGH_AS_0510]
MKQGKEWFRSIRGVHNAREARKRVDTVDKRGS